MNPVNGCGGREEWEEYWLLTKKRATRSDHFSSARYLPDRGSLRVPLKDRQYVVKTIPNGLSP